jgi:hypothetical protein
MLPSGTRHAQVKSVDFLGYATDYSLTLIDRWELIVCARNHGMH